MDKKRTRMLFLSLLLCSLLFLTLLSTSSAAPMPKGIDGHIYELDGLTTVGSGVDFSVHDITNGQLIQGKTKSDGWYSVSLNGNDGDLIVIRAWNRYHSSNRNVTLTRVMHNVDLLLNTNNPPNITSSPITTAYVSHKYEYYVNASDPENDALNISLQEKPEGMELEGSVITWKPSKEQIGNNTVIVNVNDSELGSSQQFNITVYANKGPKGPEGGGGRKQDKNRNKTKEKEKSNIPVKTKIIEKPSATIERITMKGRIKEKQRLDVKELLKRPDNIRGLYKKVYRYLEIRPEEEIEDLENVVIEFRIEKGWLEENGAEASDVTLNRYTDNNWEQVSTEHVSSKEGYAHYRAQTSGFSYFAASLKYIKEPDKITITGPKDPHVISGIIYYSSRKAQVKQGTEIMITNTATGEVFEGRTGSPENPGDYYMIISGNEGDNIEIAVKDGFIQQKTSIILEGDRSYADLVLTSKGMSAITGNAVAPLTPVSKKSSIAAIAVLLLASLGYLGYKKEISKNP